MAMHINNVTIPTSMNRGKYKFNPPETLGKNGLGEPVQGGYASIEWKFATMSFTDFDWWQNTILSGLDFKRFMLCQFVNHHRVEQAFTNCIVHFPTHDDLFGNFYENVVVRIDQIG